jgi:hypothetical protein
MRLISSRLTFITKRVFPVVWFGFLALFVVGALASMGTRQDFHVEFLLIPVIMAAFGYFLMRKLVFDLVDEVWDAGSELVIRNGGTEEHVPLAEIMNISYSTSTNPQRVTLSIRRPTLLGTEITFVPPSRFLPLSKSPIVDELIQRVDAARRR